MVDSVDVNELRLGFLDTTRNPEGILSHNNRKSGTTAPLCVALMSHSHPASAAPWLGIRDCAEGREHNGGMRRACMRVRAGGVHKRLRLVSVCSRFGVAFAADPTEPGALRPKGQLPRAHGRGIGVRVTLVATHTNDCSLGLSNGTEEQQVYSAIGDTVMHVLSYGAVL